MPRIRGDNDYNSKLGRTDINDDFESICLMDRYFCRVPNPDIKEFKKYEPFALMEAKKNYSKFRRIFEGIGLSLSDIENITRVYLCSFLGLYKVENNTSGYIAFEKAFQNKNNTTEKPTQDALFKKNRSNLNFFLKQKLPQLASVCSRKSRNILIDCEEKFYFKTKDLVEINEEALKTSESGYKGYFSINEKEFCSAQKQSKSRNKKRFFYKDYHYFVLERKPASFFTLDKIIENDNTNDDLSTLTPSGIIEKGDDSLFSVFESLPRIERVELLEEFIRKNKKSKMALLAKELLKEL